MTMNPTLFKAILSMDAYNRGYDAGISVAGESLGSATIGVDSTFVIGQNDKGEFYDKLIGFYAIAYNIGGAETIISFRGTDDPAGGDAVHGWPLGDGNINSQQGQMALQFYDAVDAATAMEITSTGHSLGGGLAGFVSAIHDDNALVFDSMAFSMAASRVCTQ